MEQMTKRHIMDIMASDMKLWDTAKTEDHGAGKVTKTLNLPFGIGEYSVTLEGLKDAGKRREACGSYAAHIRGLIKERIDDEAVTSRAKAAAARVEQDNSSDSVFSGSEGVPNKSLEEKVIQRPVEAYEEPVEDDADFGKALATRRTTLRERIRRVETDLTKWRKELRATEAALEAMGDDDASEDSRTTTSGDEGESAS